jgi:acylphosphatase
MKHIKITIKGNVQGVFFRAAARDKAQDLGLKGYVENRRDGSVFIEAEGQESKLDRLISWCHYGSPRAEVESVEVEEGEMEDMKGFTIRR